MTRITQAIDDAEIDRLRAEVAALKKTLAARDTKLHRTLEAAVKSETELEAEVAALKVALDDARKEALKEAEGIYERQWNERTAEDPKATDQFNNGILAGMTELMNEIRALIDKPPAPPADG